MGTVTSKADREAQKMLEKVGLTGEEHEADQDPDAEILSLKDRYEQKKQEQKMAKKAAKAAAKKK